MSFLGRLLASVFDFFTFLRWSDRKAKILFLGLDHAGKSTLLHLLLTGKLQTHEPTFHPQKGEVQIGQIRLNAYDMGGHAAARRLWRSYCTDVSGIVFIVDTTDHKRFTEAKEELTALLSDDQLTNVPFLILGNKIDAKDAVSEAQLKEALGIYQTCGKKTTKAKLPEGTQPIEVFMCSVVKRSGYSEGFKWLSEFL